MIYLVAGCFARKFLADSIDKQNHWSNMTVFAGMKQSLDILFNIGIANISHRIASLMNYLIEGLVKRKIPILSSLKNETKSGIILLGPFKHLDRMFSALYRSNVFVTKRSNGIRLSIHFYNNEEDIEKFLSVMEVLLEKNSDVFLC